MSHLNKYLYLSILTLAFALPQPSMAQSSIPMPVFANTQKGQLFTDKGTPITVYANPDKMLNSHGLTFSDAKYYIPNEEVSKILVDEYEQIEKSRIQEQDTILFLVGSPGDIIAFSAKLYARDDERLAKVKNTTVIGGAKMIDVTDNLVSLAPIDYPAKYRVVYFRKK